MNDLIVMEKIAGWEKVKALVLDSVSLPITKRVHYRSATPRCRPRSDVRELSRI
jgi:hypothetical protein